MRRLRIALDPKLRQRFGPEICWSWRLLLSSIGFPWEEVSIDSTECDIAYVAEDTSNIDCRLCVRANVKAWEQRSKIRLATLTELDGWLLPQYKFEPRYIQLFHVDNGCFIFERDFIFDLFWLVTGQEEPYLIKDKHGFFNLSKNNIYQTKVLLQAPAAGIVCGFQKILSDLKFPTPIPRWLHGKKAAACLGHDVDCPEAIRLLEPLRVFYRQRISAFPATISIITGKRTHWHFKSWIQMERSLDVQSAFYFVACRGSLFKYATGTPDPFYEVRSKRFQELFKFLTNEGIEIGLHSSYHAFQSPERFAAEKQILEEACGKEILGNRHHYWHLNPDNPESTLLIHEKVGFRYDASLFHERYIGWRRALSLPFFPFHQKERREIKTLQIPTAWMDDQLFGHKEDNPGDRYEILRSLADKVIEQGGCLVVDVHDYVFDDVLFPGWAKLYRWLVEYLISCSNVWIDTPGCIADHWIQRYTSIVQTSQGLT